ncbi:MAG: phosphomannomutase/phosphoglucomutase [Candidatus Peribacteraceae bacterium]|nr:phosphomannomutase/phosphoglucomutase [Candidatus Peribacteraceae bacterium]
MIDPHIFRAYDIRGKAHSQLSADACRQIGQAFGTVLRRMYSKDHPTVIVGRDARTHGPELEKALIDGLVMAGCHVLKIGQTPSPLNYFTICDRKADGGVHVTASHNPKEDNGLKLQIRDADAFSGDDLQTLRKQIESNDFMTGEGSQEEIDGLTPYKEFLAKTFKNAGKGLTIVVDAGNGVAGPVNCEIFRAVGATVIELFTEPDGNFPNHPADPSKHSTLKDLQAKVKEVKADLGFGFDGDGDRLGLVDEKGMIRSADEILLLLAQDHLQRKKGAPVVFTVSNSEILNTEIERLGGKPYMTKVGHSFVEHAMREHRAQLGGEQSGHFFCGEDYYGFDDALVAGLRILSILKASGGKFVSDRMDEFPQVFQAPELRPHCPDDAKGKIIAAITAHFSKDHPVNTLDGVRIDFGDGAWAGIRQSNTSPCISVCMEARSPEKLKEVQKTVMDHLKKYPEISLSA